MKSIKLFIFDIDNTITTGQSIWEIMHRECGTWESHGLPYWEQFLAGKFDFDEFCRRDVACWRGQPQAILDKAIQQITYRPGFAELMKQLQEKKIATAIISGTVGQFADYLAEKYGIAHVFANPIGISNGVLDGTTTINVPGNGKGLIIEKLLRTLQIGRHETAVVGDSHFDIAMFAHAEHSFIVENEKYKEHSRYFVQDFYEISAMLY